MDFGLSEEQELLQETVRGFVDNECPPTRLREIFDGDTGHDAAIWGGLVEMGLAGLALPDEHGGAGLEVLDLALVAEVLGEGAVPGPFLGHALAGLAIAWGGSDAQKQAWLPKLATGDALGSVALAEPDASGGSWQADQWTARLVDGRLRGAKSYVPCGDLADVLVVGTAGGGLALVERATDGVKLEALDGIDRTRRLAQVVFDGAAAEALPGGAATAARVRDAGLVLLAADSFGGAWKLLRLTIDYAGQREQFATRLTQFQAVKHQLADAATDIEPARALMWYAAHAQDQIPDEAPHAAAVAKAHITDRAMDVARECVELHGGIGFTWECDVQIWFKRMMFNRMFLGSPEAHRERSAQLAGW